MISAAELVTRVAQITGLPNSTVHSVKRRFVESGIWPSSRGAYVPSLEPKHLTLMLLALLADVPSKDASNVANDYWALRDADGNYLGEVLTDMIESFKTIKGEASDLAGITYKSRVEVDCGKPRACITTQCVEGNIETLYGTQSAQWSDVRVRRSMTISGKVLFDLAVGIYFNRWPGDLDVAI
jgi:hypothetical protein